MQQLPIEIDQDRIAEFCQKHHITKLALFGSVLTPDFREDSDVDVLVEFDPEHIPTFFDVFDMEAELSNLLGRKVDLRTREEISKFFRDQVLETALVQYAA